MKNGIENNICAFCENACHLSDKDKMLCNFFGVVKKSYTCKKFSFDPMKHEPPKAANLPEFEAVDIE